MDLVDIIHTRCPFSAPDCDSGFTTVQLCWCSGWLAWESKIANPYYPASQFHQAWDRGKRDRERSENSFHHPLAIAATGGCHD